MFKEMTFQQHVLELRKRLLVVLLVTLVFAVGGYFVFPYVFDYLHSVVSEKLYVTKIYEGFTTRIQISFLVGFFLCIPVLLYQITAFILPALYKREKTVVLLLLISVFLLFIFGIGYSLRFVLPISIDFLKSSSFYPLNLDRLISYNSFFLFFVKFMIAFGLCFQFPIVLITLLYFKILKMGTLRKYFKYFIALAFLVSGILTPPDVISQIMISIPMIILYGVCILIGKLFRLG